MKHYGQKLVCVMVALVLILCAAFPVFAEGEPATVDALMTGDAIQQIVNDNDCVIFEAGTYSGLSLTITGTKEFLLNGEVTFNGGNAKVPGIRLTDANLTIQDGSADGVSSLTITGYNGGIVAEGTANSLIVPDTALNIKDNASVGINFIGEFNLRIGGESYASADGTRVTKEIAEARDYVASLSINGSGYTGMQNADADVTDESAQRYFQRKPGITWHPCPSTDPATPVCRTPTRT